METKVLKLGTSCADRATGLTGTLTHWILGMDARVYYVFQPKGLTEDGQPMKKIYVCAERLAVKLGDYENREVPLNILGSQVKNAASGFEGMAITFILHNTGCFHVEVQPKGTLPKGGPIASHEFALTELSGKEIPVQTKQQRAANIADRPSPSGLPAQKDYT